MRRAYSGGMYADPPDRRDARWHPEGEPGTVAEVVWLFLPIVVVAGFVWWFYMLGAMVGESCSPRCNVGAINTAFGVTIAAIVCVALVLLIVRHKQRWRSWPISAISIVLIIATGIVASAAMSNVAAG